MILPRNCGPLAERYLRTFPVLYLLGPRQAGKTSFARWLRPNWRYMDLERKSDLDLVRQSSELFFTQYPQNLILDEAQEFPELFKTIRGVGDSR